MKIPSYKRCADRAIERLPPPTRVRLPIKGMEPLVNIGDQVDVGMMVARTAPDVAWQRCRHTPLNGEVTALDTTPPDGDVTEIVIEGQVADARPCATHVDAATLAPDDIVAAARDAGIVGMGGAMFPTYLKLTPGVPIDCVIVNACESEPYVTSDHRVLVEQREQVECGMRLAMRAVGAERGEIATDERGYPYGHERFVIRELMDREIPRGGLPKDVGAVVINAQTARSLHEAVCAARPLIERVITVDGDAVGKPGNYIVPIGTEVRHVLAECEVDLDRASMLLGGGPMMGEKMGLDSPVTPGTGAVLALSEGQTKSVVDGPCVRCGECMEACPMGLPAGLLSAHPDEMVLQCIECGVCQYVCVGERPLVDRLRQAKAKIREQQGDKR